MLDWLKFYFVSGNAFFGGAGLILAACLLGLIFRTRVTRYVIHFMMVLGYVMLFISTTPMWGWFYGIGIGVGVVWMGAEVFKREKNTIVNSLLMCVLIWAMIGVFIEWPYRQMEKVPGQFSELFVVGDSVSQGIGREKEPWPAVLAKEHQIKVVNLAIGGATVGSAMSQAKKIDVDRTLVLLEIGGNDLLGFTPPSEFEKNLDDLLRTISRVPGRTLLMFELPLFPSRQVFGTIQRELARKYHVTLIPKRYFADVLCSPGATVDGIHLSDAGHAHMAQTVWNLIGYSMAK